MRMFCILLQRIGRQKENLVSFSTFLPCQSPVPTLLTCWSTGEAARDKPGDGEAGPGAQLPPRHSQLSPGGALQVRQEELVGGQPSFTDMLRVIHIG